MAVDFKDSQTKENLMRAFAGESQARNRYTIAAKKAEKLGMYAVRDIFLFTADQERAHAERYYELLKTLNGETVFIDGGYPVEHPDALAGLLRAAEHDERQEFEDIYPNFGDIAKGEGFMEAASAFYQIADIEHIHEQRFAMVAELLEKGSFYKAQEENGLWMCTNCGYIHEGKSVPNQCPVCRYEQGYFIPFALAPYMTEGMILKK